MIARAWMRWILETIPSSAWPGTITIIIVFSLFGTVRSTGLGALAVPAGQRRRLTVVAVVGADLVAGALRGGWSAVMLPTVTFRVTGPLADPLMALWLRGLSRSAVFPIVLSAANRHRIRHGLEYRHGRSDRHVRGALCGDHCLLHMADGRPVSTTFGALDRYSASIAILGSFAVVGRRFPVDLASDG